MKRTINIYKWQDGKLVVFRYSKRGFSKYLRKYPNKWSYNFYLENGNFVK